MFLPVLLLRDFGPWGYVTFAIPNIVGAAAMGWVLRDAAASERLVARHRAACVAFSVVTAAFHVFWLAWLGASRTPDATPALGAAFLTMGAALTIGVSIGLAARARPIASLAQWLLSIAAMLVFLTGVWWVDPYASGYFPPLTERQPFLPTHDLLWLAPVCCFGFALCPYLDLTFHRARQATTPAGGRTAFTLGFGIFFSTMILFTLLYWSVIWSGYSSAATSFSLLAIAAHLFSQAGFTITLHCEQAARAVRLTRARAAIAILLLVALLIGFALASERPGAAIFMPWSESRITSGEAIYRAFMAFYGLYFPAYVWLCVIPTRRHPPGPTRAKLIVWAVACTLATPCYWLGFIDRQTWWLVPGLAIVLLSRLALRPFGKTHPAG